MLSTQLYRLYESLTRSDPPNPADLIFVLAGKMERKQYAIELYRAGVAPRLLLSIGRFEVSKMRAIGFASADELIALRDRTPPEQRHFFCEMNASGIRIERPKLRRWNTYGEILGLREYLGRDNPRSINVVSTDIHLRRVADVFDRVFRNAPLEAHYCPVPARCSSLRKEEWWARANDRSYVVKELTKLAAYRTILTMPEFMVRNLMRLNE
jgi:uncharacterized SAM-binding protein YcdF (DUF218 family)